MDTVSSSTPHLFAPPVFRSRFAQLLTIFALLLVLSACSQSEVTHEATVSDVTIRPTPAAVAVSTSTTKTLTTQHGVTTAGFSHNGNKDKAEPTPTPSITNEQARKQWAGYYDELFSYLDDIAGDKRVVKAEAELVKCVAEAGYEITGSQEFMSYRQHREHEMVRGIALEQGTFHPSFKNDNATYLAFERHIEAFSNDTEHCEKAFLRVSYEVEKDYERPTFPQAESVNPQGLTEKAPLGDLDDFDALISLSVPADSHRVEIADVSHAGLSETCPNLAVLFESATVEDSAAFTRISDSHETYTWVAKVGTQAANELYAQSRSVLKECLTEAGWFRYEDDRYFGTDDLYFYQGARRYGQQQSIFIHKTRDIFGFVAVIDSGELQSSFGHIAAAYEDTFIRGLAGMKCDDAFCIYLPK